MLNNTPYYSLPSHNYYIQLNRLHTIALIKQLIYLSVKTYKGLINELPANGIFVFGSNTQGRHSLGAALIAKTKFGAKYGQPDGLQGRSYAIVTKDLTKDTHPSYPKEMITIQIATLYAFAKLAWQSEFYIAYGIRSNLNGYTPQEMADMFKEAINWCDPKEIPSNITFNEEFAKLIV